MYQNGWKSREKERKERMGPPVIVSQGKARQVRSDQSQMEGKLASRGAGAAHDRLILPWLLPLVVRAPNDLTDSFSVRYVI